MKNMKKVNKVFPSKGCNMFSESSINIIKDTLFKVRDMYEDYYHFDKVFVCVDEHTMEVIDYVYEGVE